jgi:hypothetical protein
MGFFDLLHIFIDMKTKEEITQYKKEWAEKNKELISKKSKERYEKNKERLKEYQSEYRKNNPEKKKELRKRYYEENKDISLEKMKMYYEKNKEDINEYKKEWAEKNKERLKIKRKEYYEKNKSIMFEKHKNRLLNDPIYALSTSIRKNILKAFRKRGFEKENSTTKILGCSFEEFKLHLESQFEPWMNWNNRGKYNGELNYGWDIDHIIPSSIAETVEDVLKLNHHTNLKPLCSKINRDIKRDN